MITSLILVANIVVSTPGRFNPQVAVVKESKLYVASEPRSYAAEVVDSGGRSKHLIVFFQRHTMGTT